MKKLIRIPALIVCIFVAGKSMAQTTTAVKPVTQQTPPISQASKTIVKTTMPDPVAAVAVQGIEVVKPVTVTVVKLPAVSDQGGKPKQ